MENSINSAEVSENLQKLRSLDLQSLYDGNRDIASGEDDGIELNRKRDAPVSIEIGLIECTKRKRSRKEVPLSSFEAVNRNSKRISNAVDELRLEQHVLDWKDLAKVTSDHVSGEGNSRKLIDLNDVPISLDGNAALIPKRPRCFTRRKKVQHNHITMPADSEKTISDAQSVKLEDQSVTQTLSSETKSRANGNSRENSFCTANSVRSLVAKESASIRYTGISAEVVRRDHGDNGELEHQVHSSMDMSKAAVNNAAEPCENLHEDEENAARMLSSRFDHSCTAFSGNEAASASEPVNVSSSGLSHHGDYANSLSKHSAHLEANDSDGAGRILRPRRTEKHRRYTRKRRHYYEILSSDVNAFWIINRKIKIFWPLDESWYFGLVTNYDPQRKFHHVKYDDREEEWINLDKERFKLLLLPEEAPRRRNSGNSGRVRKNVVAEKGDTKVGNDTCGDGFMESEPLIAWLARSTRRVKSSLLGARKKRKIYSQSKSMATTMLLEDRVSSVPGCMDDSDLRADVSNSSSSSAFPDKLDDTEMSDRARSESCVYIRKRYRQRCQELGSTSDNSECRSIVLYDPSIFCTERFRQLKEEVIADTCLDVNNLDPACVLWFGENLGLLKPTACAVNSRQVMLRLLVQLTFVGHAYEAENVWLCHTLLLMQYGTVTVMWPNVQLKMLFVDNVVGLRVLLFEGCLVQAVSFVCLVLLAFNRPNEYNERLDRQIPINSVRFEISGVSNVRRRFVFVFYNFMEIKSSKLHYLDNKLKQYCSILKQLPLSDCTYDNIKNLQSQSNLLPFAVCGKPVSFEGSCERSRQGIILKRVTKQSTYVNLSLSSSTSNEVAKKVPQIVLPFSAAPTFFLSLHLQLLMAKSVASISFCNSLPLLEGPGNFSRSIADDGSLVQELPDQTTPVHEMECSLSRTDTVSGLSSAGSEMDVDVLSHNNDRESESTPLKCVDSNNDVVEASIDVQVSLPALGEGQSSQDTESLSRLKGITVEIPAVCQEESQSCNVEVQVRQQSTSDSVWSPNNSAFRSPNPTAPRSIWHRNRQNSGSMSFGHRSNMWPDDGKVGSSTPNGLVNGSKKPRNQNSYLLPFGNYDFNSKPRSHHRKGRPYKRLRTDNEKAVSNDPQSPQRRVELMSCDANVLITTGDRGWRESGARVVLENIDHNEWRLVVKISGVIKYSYKAYQFLQPGNPNRYTHAMMWKGEKDWILEFPDRSQWAMFKELHEECYNRNLRAASVKTIPIPGVRLIEESVDNGVELPFARSFPKYFQQVETDVDMALNPLRVLYDMDSDDEEWISKRRASSDASVSSQTEMSEEIFEKTIDMLEKVAYTQQHEDLTGIEIEELMGGGVPVQLIKDIYEYWKQKRRKKGLPLIRQLQPPLWKRYQQQLKEWELGLNQIHHYPNGCKEKAVLLEKPAMFAFCLRPRGLEVPNKGSKQRSHRKLSTTPSFSRDSDGHHSFGRRSNGFAYGDERQDSWQMSTRVISPRDPAGYMSMSSDGSERSHHRKPHRNKSRRLGNIIYDADYHPQMIASPSSNPRLVVNKRNGFSSPSSSSTTKWNGVGIPEWPTTPTHNHHHHPQVGFQKQKVVERLGVPDLDEFRLRDASSAARHACNMAKLKREEAQRLMCRADVAIHKAIVALMTAEAMKASSVENTQDDG
ncbi:hypothetical protein ACHQM5_002339 [Ranunculus cassubicifolius]